MIKVNERGAWLNMGEGQMFDAALAQRIEKILINLGVYTMIDIGCGDGSYTRYMNENGFNCVGYDGNPNTEHITHNLCRVLDFSEKQDVGLFDAALSLEVGEHIPAQYEDVF